MYEWGKFVVPPERMKHVTCHKIDDDNQWKKKPCLIFAFSKKQKLSYRNVCIPLQLWLNLFQYVRYVDLTMNRLSFYCETLLWYDVEKPASVERWLDYVWNENFLDLPDKLMSQHGILWYVQFFWCSHWVFHRHTQPCCRYKYILSYLKSENPKASEASFFPSLPPRQKIVNSRKAVKNQKHFLCFLFAVLIVFVNAF